MIGSSICLWVECESKFNCDVYCCSFVVVFRFFFLGAAIGDGNGGGGHGLVGTCGGANEGGGGSWRVGMAGGG